MSICRNTQRRRGRAATLILLLCAALAAPAHAGSYITVGDGPNCTRPTIQGAIDWARNSMVGGYSVIRISNNNDPDKVWYENLTIPTNADDSHPAVDLDIVGGYLNCESDVPTGRATISGSLHEKPTVKITGDRTVNLRGLNIRDGERDSTAYLGGGIYYVGHGTLGLAEVAITGNGPAGIEVDGRGGEAFLDLQGGVVVSRNDFEGIVAGGSTRVHLHSTWNQIVDNGATGLVLTDASHARIESSGNVFAGNGGYGIGIVGSGANSGRVTHIDSIDPADPLALTGNKQGAIYLESLGPTTLLCARNLRIDANGDAQQPSATVRVAGNARFEMNTACDWETPTPPCAAGRSRCNSVSYNSSGDGYPLFQAISGGSIVADRLWVEMNAASSIFSTNLGSATASGANITVSNTVMTGNTLRDNFVEALNGGFVELLASTLRGSSGSPTFLGVNPGGLVVRDSIVDRSQLLLDTDTPERTRVANVLSPHRLGTHVGDTIIEASVQFLPDSLCLRPDAPGIDHAEAGPFALDVFAQPRVVNNLLVQDFNGARDVGACENQTSTDRIFGNGFERRPD